MSVIAGGAWCTFDRDGLIVKRMSFLKGFTLIEIMTFERSHCSYERGLGYYLVWPRRALRGPAQKFKDWVVGLVNRAPSDTHATA